MIIATDLDRTLIYSRAAIDAHGYAGALVAVEQYQGQDASWMTAAAGDRFAALHDSALIVPVTTRTVEQWQRIRLPGPDARFAVVANGGMLLVDGAPDADWGRAVAAQLGGVAPMTQVWEHIARVCRPEWTIALRNAGGLFCYAVVHRSRLPPGFLPEVTAWAAGLGWRVSLQGRKLYWVPASLTKSAAVAEVARRSGTEVIVAAGDSLLDADLLEAADRGVVARHGELVASGWTAPQVHVTSARGVLAGEEIVEWFAASCGGAADG